MNEFRELLLGAGHRRDKDVQTPNGKTWRNLTTLDMYEASGADIIFDLDLVAGPGQFGRLPFDDSTFDELHAYDVLEHLGVQGRYEEFFHEFREYWRILKPGGFFCATVPRSDNIHTWGDPGHRRVINELTLVYFSKAEVDKQLGITTITDYKRYMGDMDFEVVHLQLGEERTAFVMRKLPLDKTSELGPK